MFRKRLFSLIVICALAASSAAQIRSRSVTKEDDPKLRVLFIGNSYTYYNNLPEIFKQLAAAANKPVETEMVVRGGATLKIHWEDGQAAKRIKQSHWDYVILQEQSLQPINDPSTMHKYARLFDAEIKASGSKTVFFMTWARQNRPETQAALTDAYAKIAKELNALLVPVGQVWQQAFKENPQIVLHLPDQSHPNSMGSYLSACLFFAVLLARSPENLPGLIVGKSVSTDGRVNEEKSELVSLNKGDAAFLQRLAWQTIKGVKEARK